MSNPRDNHDASHRAQQREQVEPSERNQPVPLLVVALTLVMVAFGIGYILLSESFGRTDLGDRRTLVDLAGPAAKTGQDADGKQLYAANCVACHQANGKGLPGVFPPLDGSEWVNGDPRVLVNIVLHGVTGEMSVMGQTYKGAMPAFGQLGDAELAAVLSHVRSTWANKSAPVVVELVEKERKAKLRSTPFTSGDEVKALAAKTP
jgi:mono/diheme cytochrome c family protein